MYSHKELLQVLEHFPQMVCWKNISSGNFAGCNKQFADFVGLSSPSEVNGKNGIDFFEPEVVKLIIDYEQQAIASKSAITINEEIFDKRTGLTAIDLTIVPIFDEHQKLTNIIYYGSPVILLSKKSWKEALEFINKENMPKLLRNNKYFVQGKFGQIKLTKREAECALYIIKGLTFKEVSNYMGLAPGTVYNYIDNIKLKLDCSKRSELLGILMSSNFIDNF